MLPVRVLLCCALVGFVHSTVFDSLKASKILRSKARAELAIKVHAAFKSDRFKAAGGLRSKELSEDSFSSTGSVYQSIYFSTDGTPDDTCSDVSTVIGFMVDQCIVETGYAYKFQLTTDSCEGAITQYFGDVDCIQYLGSSSFDDVSLGCAPVQDPAAGPNEYQQIQCTTREDPAFPDNVVAGEFYEDTTCDGATVEYEAFVVDKCYSAGEEYFAYKCDNDLPMVGLFLNPDCAGPPIYELDFPSMCYLEENDDTEVGAQYSNGDDQPFPANDNQVPTNSTNDDQFSTHDDQILPHDDQISTHDDQQFPTNSTNDDQFSNHDDQLLPHDDQFATDDFQFPSDDYHHTTDDADSYLPPIINPPPSVSTTPFPTVKGAARSTAVFCTFNEPTLKPVGQPTMSPTHAAPAARPTKMPTFRPSTTGSPTKKPTRRPTTTPQPSEVPTTAPTELPTGAPTLFPTRAVAKESTFEVNQALVGIDAVTFNANEANAAALKLTIADALLDRNSVISNLRVADADTTTSPPGPLATVNLRATLNHGKVAWDTTSQVTVAYTVTSPWSVYTAKQLYTQLSDAVTSGAFTTALVANAQSLGATDIVACSSESVVAADLDATDDDASAAVNAARESLSSGGIFGVVVGVLFIAIMFIGGIYVIFAKKV